jgi:histidyl-tRNA synthetase
MVTRLCERLGVGAVTMRVNSLGDNDSRAKYRDVLRSYLKQHLSELCESCQKRVDTNPLRVLDCKREGCRAVVAKAPDIADSWSDASRQQFARVEELLRATGIAYAREPRLVRGLDYYTGTIFEVTTSGLGAQDAILGGGRYDDLVGELDGPATPAIGFAAGVERLALLLEKTRPELVNSRAPHLYIAPMPGAVARALKLADEVRTAGPWRVEVDVSGGRVKNQMKRADRLGSLTALVLGDDELASGRGKLKHMRSEDGVASEVELNGAALTARLQELIARS